MRKGIVRIMTSVALVLASAAMTVCGKDAPPYRIIHETFQQPVDHAKPAGKMFPQQVDVLIPDGAPADAAVFFNLGNEHDLADRDIMGLYKAYGSPADVIFIQAEHRGYGQSVTDDADQSVPMYVTVDQALADFHRVAAEYRKRYPGPWMGTGYSYGGGLVIHFAARYPDDVKVILSSSGVIDWPFAMDAYDRGVRRAFGEAAYGRLAGHIRNLEPKEMFDDIWLEREFLIAIIHGVTQYGRYKSLMPLVKLMTFLPNVAFIRVLHWIDDGIAGKGGWLYATSNAKRTLSREEAVTGRWGWRLWRRQQCDETGVFEVSAGSPGIFTRTRADFIRECGSLFGGFPGTARGKEWSPRSFLKELRVPLVYVGGGMDPWMGLCLEPDYPLKKGRYFYRPEARHCPDHNDDPELAKEVLAEMLAWARAGK